MIIVLTHFVVVRDILKHADNALEREGPPGVNRTKKRKKFWNVRSHVHVGKQGGGWVFLAKLAYVFLDVFFILVLFISARRLPKQKIDRLHQFHCVIHDSSEACFDYVSHLVVFKVIRHQGQRKMDSG